MPHLALWAGLGMKRASEAPLEIPGVRISWLIPEPPLSDETRSDWIRRMAQLVPHDADFIGGFSLGGMLALEQLTFFPHCMGLVLLSYAADRNSWQPYLRLLASSGLLHLLLLIPPRALLRIAIGLMKFFGKNTYRTMSAALTQWTAVETRKILHFLLQARKKELAVPLVQLIGTKDPWLRPGLDAIPIAGAGHFFFPKYKNELSRQISHWIKSLV